MTFWKMSYSLVLSRYNVRHTCKVIKSNLKTVCSHILLDKLCVWLYKRFWASLVSKRYAFKEAPVGEEFKNTWMKSGTTWQENTVRCKMWRIRSLKIVCSNSGQSVQTANFGGKTLFFLCRSIIPITPKQTQLQ